VQKPRGAFHELLRTAKKYPHLDLTNAIKEMNKLLLPDDRAEIRAILIDVCRSYMPNWGNI
jgi:hypothetical protein